MTTAYFKKKNQPAGNNSQAINATITQT